MIPAAFGSKKFEVSSKKIYTPNGVSLSEELDVTETEVKGGKPTVSFKGVKLQSLSFEVILDRMFVDVYSEITFWKKKLLSKKSETFKLGKHTLGRYYLTKYDLKEINLSRTGEYTRAVLTLSFAEDAYYNPNPAPAKVEPVKNSKPPANKLRKGSTIKPKSGVRWYETADGALKKSGKSGKAHQKNMTVTYYYTKNGKVVCVNPQGLGWLKVEDVTVIKY